MSSVKIGLFFGSFNPIHYGHIHIAKQIFEHINLSQIWFVLSPSNPFKNKEELLNEYDRIQLLKLALDGNCSFKALDIECRMPKPSYTIHTLLKLEENNPTIEFILIIGSDLVPELRKWHQIDNLISKYLFLIYTRPDFPLNNSELNYINRYIIFKLELLNISSTEIRQKIRKKESIEHLVPDQVKNKIAEDSFYSN